MSSNPLTVSLSPHQTNTRVHISNHKCPLHQANRVDDWEILEEELKRMISLRSLLYSSCCGILNSSNSLSVFSIFLFSSSTCSTRLAVLSYLATSYSWSILSTDVSVLAELVGIPALFKKRVLPLTWEWTWPWERQRTMGTTSALVIGSCPSATGSARIISIAFCEIQAVNIRLQIVEEGFNWKPKRLVQNK